MTRGTIAVLNHGSVNHALVSWLWSVIQHDAERYHLILPFGCEITRQRNAAVEEMRGDWILFVDSDCVPPLDAITLLERECVGVIGGVYLERSSHRDVCATKTFEPTVRYQWSEISHTGVIPVLAVGTGCLMVRRHVLEDVPSPWFRCGQLVMDAITEDTEFCLRAAERGYVSYLHTGVRVGHVMSVVMWPHEDGTSWAQWEGEVYREPLDLDVEVTA